MNENTAYRGRAVNPSPALQRYGAGPGPVTGCVNTPATVPDSFSAFTATVASGSSSGVPSGVYPDLLLQRCDRQHCTTNPQVDARLVTATSPEALIATPPDSLLPPGTFAVRSCLPARADQTHACPASYESQPITS